MSECNLNLIDACDRAVAIVSHSHGMDRLYHRAVQQLGAGELRLGILDRASGALEDKDLRDEVFATDGSLLSFLCGIWIQFLLTEIAGVQKEKMHTIAEKLFSQTQDKRLFH